MCLSPHSKERLKLEDELAASEKDMWDKTQRSVLALVSQRAAEFTERLEKHHKQRTGGAVVSPRR
jgi:hypothetical protein